MKYLISLVVGMVVGVAAFLALLYYNPMTSQNKLSPLSVSDNDVIAFNYSAVATDALVYTNDGKSTIAPYPSKVLQLWEPTIRLTDAMATVLRNSRNQPAAIGSSFRHAPRAREFSTAKRSSTAPGTSTCPAGEACSSNSGKITGAICGKS